MTFISDSSLVTLDPHMKNVNALQNQEKQDVDQVRSLLFVFVWVVLNPQLERVYSF